VTANCAVLELDQPDPSTRRALSRLERAVTAVDHQSVVLFVGNERIDIPEAMLVLFLQAIHEQAAGHRVRLLAPDAQDELTPNQAAAYLGISRPLLVKLLDDGTIPARALPGSRHRKIAVADLEAYHQRKNQRRRRIAAAMDDVADSGLYLPED
jgi:excisionase family DNA binding protein